MHSAILLANENEKLRTENHRQKRRRVKKRSYILKGGVLTGAEAQSLIEKEQNTNVEVIENEVAQGRQRALPKCSICQSLQHNVRTCPERQRTI
jgi:hypothetical protein